ncbi:MAG: MFS transporter [Gammaproteobacteria bacterium]
MRTSTVYNSKTNIVAGVIGNILEWYDFAVFGFLAPVMSPLFFPADDPLAGLIKTYGIFAAGYLMRPLGGIVFGQIGDRLGRKKALQLSIMMMAIPTVLVGVLPTHQQLGAGAPLLLIVLRLLQGISVGGELIGSVSYLVETAPNDRRGLHGSWSLFSAVGGILLGSGVVAILVNVLDHQSMQLWGWRLPFLSGILILVIGAWLRKGLAESPEFLKAKAAGTIQGNPMAEVLKEMPLRVLQLSMIILLFGTSFYILFVWMPTYLSKIVTPPVEHALWVNTVAMTLLIAVIPVAGLLSDKFGRKKVLFTATFLLGILVYPLFMLIDQGDMKAALIAQLVFATLVGSIQGPVPALMVEMFPTRSRYSAIGLGYNLTLAVFGGTSPLVCTWIIRETGDLASPAVYLLILAVVSFIGLWALKTENAFDLN